MVGSDAALAAEYPQVAGITWLDQRWSVVRILPVISLIAVHEGGSKMRSLILTLLLALSACASLAAESASRVGCDESEITTSNVRTVGVPIRVNWDATCKNQHFVCSRTGAPGVGRSSSPARRRSESFRDERWFMRYESPLIG